MKIYYLGTCSGTEPMKGTHQTSFVLEIDGALYWFDAGEGCAHTAVTVAGLDITKTEALFISHPHIDHTGGLPHLLFCLDKLIWRYKAPLANQNRLEVYFADTALLEAAKALALSGSAGDFRFVLNGHGICDGPLFRDRNLRVSALHNLHLGECKDGMWRSFSFLLEADGKRIVYSGDIKRLDELDPLVGNGVDFLIAETGHHAVADVCEYALAHGVCNLRFVHHGREILGDVEAAERLVAEYVRGGMRSACICRDGMQEEI